MTFAAALLGAALCGCTSTRDRGWITLFDGAHPETLANWGRVGEDNWRIAGRRRDGRCEQGAGKHLSGFEAVLFGRGDRAEVWVTPDINSGVFFRCSDPTSISARNCYEMNI